MSRRRSAPPPTATPRSTTCVAAKVSQEEAIRIEESAAYVTDKARIAIDAERFAVAKSLPLLAQQLNEHDKALAAYEALDPAARAYAESLQDQQKQAILMTAIMLKLVSVMDPDAFPPEYTTKFFADIALPTAIPGSSSNATTSSPKRS